MKFLFVADPVAYLKPASDSSFSLLRESLSEGHQVFWCHDTDIEYRGREVVVTAAPVLECGSDQAPALGAPLRFTVSEMDACLIRKDPPFDVGYVRLCWLLSLVETRVWMMNRPSLLLRYHEKLIPLEAHAQGYLHDDDIIPTHVGTLERAKEFVREAKPGQVIMKPFLGFGGGGIRLLEEKVFLSLAESFPAGEVIVQPFRDDILRRGDRRVFLLGGEVLAHFVRMPKPGGFVSNLAQGGSAVAVPLLPREAETLTRLGRFLTAAGIVLAGADLIGHRLSEVNITSPTGLRSLEQLEGKDYAVDIIDYVERNAAAHKR